MAHTERRGWVTVDALGPTRLDDSQRDRKGRCWCCSGWKRAARRDDRHKARAALLRDPEHA